MKKGSKTEALNRNLSVAKEDRKTPSVGIAARLAIHEARIDRLLLTVESSFFEIGKELAEVQAEGDFAESTFEQYLKNRWGKSRSWGYQMIEGYKAKAELPENVQHVVQNQRQALAVAKIPKAKRAEAVREVAKEGKVTAKKIAEKADPEEAEFRVVVKDANGDEVPENISAEFQRAEREAKEHISFAQQVKNYLERDDVTTIEARGLRETAKDLLAGLKTHLTKHVLCPKCAGKKCSVCSKRGFVSNHFATKGMGKK